MTRTLTFLFFFILTISVFGQESDEDLVRKAIESYKSSLLNNNGEDAVKYIDSRTFKYYSDILDLVKNADSSKVETNSLLDKLTVLLIRHKVSKKDILSFDGQTFFIYTIESGMSGKGIEKSTIGVITIEDSKAKVQLIANGQIAPVLLLLRKEGGNWKIDLTALLSFQNSTFQKMEKNYGKSETEYIFNILEKATGKKPCSEIWQPINSMRN
jgi:hypothetical protein